LNVDERAIADLLDALATELRIIGVQ
jgi:hypothetical protein